MNEIDEEASEAFADFAQGLIDARRYTPIYAAACSLVQLLALHTPEDRLSAVLRLVIQAFAMGARDAGHEVEISMDAGDLH